MKKQTAALFLLFIINVFMPAKFNAMERKGHSEEDSSYFIDLAPELKNCVLIIGIETIIKNNNICEPFKGIGAFINSFRTIDGICRELAKLINIESLKAIAKNHLVGDELKVLDIAELNEKLAKILTYTLNGCGGEFDNAQDAKEHLVAAEEEAIELLMAGANPNLDFNTFNTKKKSREKFVLIASIKVDFDKLALLLIIYGANVNAKDSRGYNPLFGSIMYSPIEVTRALLAHGADVNLIDELSYSPLYLAIENERYNLIEDLLRHGADPSLRANGPYARSPLVFAIIENNIEVVKMLLKYEPNLNSKDFANKTPLKIAKGLKQTEMIKLLEDYQAKKNHRNTKKKKSGRCILS